MATPQALPPPHSTTISHVTHVPNAPVPKFKGTDVFFQTWKKCFWLLIEGVDKYLHIIIEKCHTNLYLVPPLHHLTMMELV